MKESSQSHRAIAWRRALLATGVAAALFVPVMAQETSKDAKPAVKAEKAPQTTPQGKGHWGPGNEYSDTVDFGVFVGGTRYNADHNGFGVKLHTGGLVGFQITENPWKWIGIEESYAYHVNNATAETPMAPGEPNYAAGARMNEFGLAIVLPQAARIAVPALRQPRRCTARLPSDQNVQQRSLIRSRPSSGRAGSAVRRCGR